MSLLTISLLVVFGGLSVVVIPSTMILLTECLGAFFHRVDLDASHADAGSAVSAVLIPAHNEEATIAATLTGILPSSPANRVVVIADNCTDATAQLAVESGAEVVVRHDETRVGKGYALARGVDYLRDNPPEVVVVIDADTHVTPGTIGAISRHAAHSGQPVQAINLLHPRPAASYIEYLSAFAFRVRNLVRPRGQSVLGLPCQLMGTGMAVPWCLMSKLNLASSNLVEDMQLGIDCAIAGAPAIFNIHGKVTGVLPSSKRGARSQRRRWEHGHLATITSQVPRLMMEAIRQRRLELVWLALDLAVPPLALVVTLWLLFAIVSLLLLLQSHLAGPLVLAAAAGISLFASILAGWLRFARDIPIAALVSVPFYVIGKLPMYFGFLLRRQVHWVRTERVGSV